MRLMSLHAIEDVVEWSIRALHARYPDEDPSVRDAIAALYAFQNGYDCSFTHFRLMEVLLSRRFTYRFALSEHPDHARIGEFLSGITDFTALSDEHENPDDWLELGYVDPPYLYCDAGSALWRRMAAAGKLTGADAEPPRPPALEAVVLEVVCAAESTGDVELIAWWHAIGWLELRERVATEDPPVVAAVRAIREAAIRSGALSHDAPGEYRLPPEAFDEGGLDAWWAGREDHDLEFLR
ncbi:hypothetical protein ACWEKT_36305 [Nocardia takedensis]